MLPVWNPALPWQKKVGCYNNSLRCFKQDAQTKPRNRQTARWRNRKTPVAHLKRLTCFAWSPFHLKVAIKHETLPRLRRSGKSLGTVAGQRNETVYYFAEHVELSSRPLRRPAISASNAL